MRKLIVTTKLTKFALALVVIGCGGGESTGPTTPPAPVPASITLSAPAASAVVATSVSVQASVTTSTGAPVPNATVSFSVSSGGGSVSPLSSTTDASGRATTQWTLGQLAVANSLTASVGAVAATPVTVTAKAGPVATMAITGGNAQTAAMGGALASSPSVTLKDAFGNLVSGAPVAFAVTAGGGTVAQPSTVSNDQGIASAGTWTLGTTSITQLVTASSAGAPTVTITASALNPWTVSTSGTIVTASRSADEGALFGGPPTWANTNLLIAPLLAVACSQGTILIQVFSSRLITQSGAVTYQIDNGTRVGATWLEQSPNFNAIYHPGPKSATGTLISQMSAGTTFNISFRTFGSGTLYAPNFSMVGLREVLPQVMAACPGAVPSKTPLPEASGDVDAIARGVEAILRARERR